MTEAYIGIGANIDPDANIKNSIVMIAAKFSVTGISTVYLTEAEGRPEQPPYFNCVVRIETEVPPLELKRQLRTIEDSLGRKRSVDKYASRTIDLDLILYGDLAVRSAELTLPDPDIASRPFLAVPIEELSPELSLPDSGRPIREVAAALRSRTMKPLKGYTELLRKEILHGCEH